MRTYLLSYKTLSFLTSLGNVKHCFILLKTPQYWFSSLPVYRMILFALYLVVNRVGNYT
uniref:Uncharacterized protein n=1 Tax=Arundo donax TaxID=35708 RepID=A0A0A9A8G6_ARUDO